MSSEYRTTIGYAGMVCVSRGDEVVLELTPACAIDLAGEIAFVANGGGPIEIPGRNVSGAPAPAIDKHAAQAALGQLNAAVGALLDPAATP